MKIAVVTEDEVTISQHFGRAPFYIVMTVENGKVTGKEKRTRSAQNTCACHHDSQADCHENHGLDIGARGKHAGMADSIADCKVLIAGGMGYGAYQSLKSSGIEPIITDSESIDAAVNLYLKGKLVNLMEKLH